jgi:hypothetical protein
MAHPLFGRRTAGCAFLFTHRGAFSELVVAICAQESRGCKTISCIDKSDDVTDAREIGGRTFRFVCSIQPQRTDELTLVKETPHLRFVNNRSIKLHKYGEGPFCRVQIPRIGGSTGVYVIAVDDRAVYVGECEKLNDRFNNGYGRISPRNCFDKGQSTNCRINRLILP